MKNSSSIRVLIEMKFDADKKLVHKKILGVFDDRDAADAADQKYQHHFDDDGNEYIYSFGAYPANEIVSW